MFQTTRRRLAIWYTIVTAIVLLVFASGMYIYVRSTLIERIDDTLNHVVEVVSRSIAIDKISSPGAPLQLKINVGDSFQDNSGRLDDDRIDLELFDLGGKLIWSTLREPLNLPVWLDLDGATVRINNDRILRQITAPVTSNDDRLVGFLRVSHPWFEVTKPTELLIIDLAIGTSLVVTSVAGIGWLLSGIAIEPVKASYQQLKQFTADASHELRNPIATIQANVQVALGEEPLLPQQRQQLQTIERLTRRLGKLVDDLLFLARQDSGIVMPQASLVPLDALLMETIEEQQLAAAEKGINLTLEIIDPVYSIGKLGDKEIDAFSIHGDWDRLARLFTNIIANAIQYTPAKDENKSQITIQLQQLIRQNILCLEVSIRDNGIGISSDALPLLCDRFYRVDPARTSTGSEVSSGSGLGLAIVKSIADAHQGELTIDSQVDAGTTVTVTFKAINMRS